MNKKTSSKYFYLWVIIFIIIYLTSHIIFLDSDPPSWDISMYQPIDEMFYSNTAFNLFHYHDIQHKVVPYVDSDSSILNLFGNSITYITLSIFGNNYYGLRMSSVIISLAILIFLYYTLINYIKNQSLDNSYFSINNKHIPVLLLLLYLIFDFSFLMAGRIIEPTIVRMFGMVFTIWLISTSYNQRRINSKLLAFIMGIIVLLFILLIYPTNIFLIPAIFSFYFIEGLKKGFKNALVRSLSFSLGVIIGFYIFNLLDKFLFNESIIKVFLINYLSYSNRIASSNNSTILIFIKNIIINFLNIFNTNIFRFNIFLLMLFLISIPVLLYKIIKDRFYMDILVTTILCFLILQTLFINDFFYRKLVIFLPLILFTILQAYLYIGRFINFIKLDRKYLYAFISYITMCFCFAFVILLYNTKGSLVPYYNLYNERVVLILLYTIQVFVTFIYIFRINTKNFLTSRRKYILLFIILILPNIYLDIKYIYYSPTYTYKKTMVTLSKYIDNKILLGGLSHGFRLYNTSIPLLNYYSYAYTVEGQNEYGLLVDKISNNNNDVYTILYNRTGYDLFYKNRIMKIFEFDLNNSIEGQSPRVALFKVKE